MKQRLGRGLTDLALVAVQYGDRVVRLFSLASFYWLPRVLRSVLLEFCSPVLGMHVMVCTEQKAGSSMAQSCDVEL